MSTNEAYPRLIAALLIVRAWLAALRVLLRILIRTHLLHQAGKCVLHLVDKTGRSLLARGLFGCLLFLLGRGLVVNRPGSFLAGPFLRVGSR